MREIKRRNNLTGSKTQYKEMLYRLLFWRCLTEAWGRELICLSLCFQRRFLDTHSSSTFLSVAYNSTAIAVAYWVVWLLISQGSSSATISSILYWDRNALSDRVMCLALQYAYFYSCPLNPCANAVYYQPSHFGLGTFLLQYTEKIPTNYSMNFKECRKNTGRKQNGTSDLISHAYIYTHMHI